MKFHQHPHDKFGLGFEKGEPSPKSDSASDKCDFCCKFGHSKFKCIHKKKQMSKGTDYVGPKKIWVPKSQIVHVIDILGRKSPGFKMVPGQWMLTTHDRGKYMFLNLNPHEGGSVAFGGIGKGKISSIDKVLIPSLASIDKVLYVKDLKYNLLSISQLCDNGYIVSFNKDQVYSQDRK